MTNAQRIDFLAGTWTEHNGFEVGVVDLVCGDALHPGRYAWRISRPGEHAGDRPKFVTGGRSADLPGAWADAFATAEHWDEES